jgi:predicted kinase
MTIDVPALCLIVLVGASGSGKSTFARKNFLATEVISSDFCRGLVSDDENDQAATKDAFEVLNFIAGKRLAAGRLTVIDATNVQPRVRRTSGRDRARPAGARVCRAERAAVRPAVRVEGDRPAALAAEAGPAQPQA